MEGIRIAQKLLRGRRTLALRSIELHDAPIDRAILAISVASVVSAKAVLECIEGERNMEDQLRYS